MKRSAIRRSVIRGAGTLALMLSAGLTHAALLVYEPFDYTPAAGLVGNNGGTGFGSAWQPGGFNASTSANYTIGNTPLQAATGPNVTTASMPVITGAIRSLQSALAGPGSVYYMSMLIRPNGTVGAGAFGGFFGMTFGNNPSTYANEVFLGKPGGGAVNRYVLENRGGTAQVATNDDVIAGDSTLLVLKLAFGSTDSEFSLYVDPLPNGIEPASADAFKSNPSLASVNYLGLYATGAFSLDEIRIGTTYTDVVPRSAVPEPSTLAMVSLVLAAALATGRRRQVSAPALAH